MDYGVCSKSNDYCLYMRKAGEYLRWTAKTGTQWESCVKANDHQEPPESGRGKKGYSLEPLEGAWPLPACIPEVRENKAVVLNSLSCPKNLIQPLSAHQVISPGRGPAEHTEEVFSSG
jgi:hypothetical protein